MNLSDNTFKLEDNEHISQVAFYLRDKLVKVKRFQNKFNINDLVSKIDTDKIICFVENDEKTSRHKVTLDL